MAEWEIRGLFGNEYALEKTVEDLKEFKGFQCVVLDRRNLSVRFHRRDRALEETVKRAFEIHHGYPEHEGPVGEYERIRREEKEKKLKKEEEKRKKKR